MPEVCWIRFTRTLDGRERVVQTKGVEVNCNSVYVYVIKVS